ncbi:hypothetical protein CBR_g20103 [Chara braunii]|uniref:Uncharacterized protein n=1 Tax=Chara braunii TaxID=69332 RepID=A0A388KZR0_CHABU|nr:hypothetical protein CBR_g20103 [Chara braunii]|eukprot:GBG75472.1 hypothetical protein CBR_g20103 [Chara braunii]
MADVLPVMQGGDVHGGGGRAGKRKTPMELRMEQMKRLKQGCAAGSGPGTDERGPLPSSAQMGAAALQQARRSCFPLTENGYGGGVGGGSGADVAKVASSGRQLEAKLLDIYPAAKARNGQREMVGSDKVLSSSAMKVGDKLFAREMVASGSVGIDNPSSCQTALRSENDGRNNDDVKDIVLEKDDDREQMRGFASAGKRNRAIGRGGGGGGASGERTTPTRPAAGAAAAVMTAWEKSVSKETRSFKNITDLASRLASNGATGSATVNMSQAIREMALDKVVVSSPLPSGSPLEKGGGVAAAAAAATRGLGLAAPGEESDGIAPLAGIAGGRARVDDVGTDAMEFDDVAAPIDLSLKRSVRFCSAEPFDWCQLASGQEESEALRRWGTMDFFDSCLPRAAYEEHGVFSDGHGVGDSEGRGGGGGGGGEEAMRRRRSSSTGRGTRFVSCLQSWVHPEYQFAEHLLASIENAARVAGGGAKGGGLGSEFLVKRVWLWEEAFRSLYYGLRHGTCDVFYYQSPQFVAMFCSGGHCTTSRTRQGGDRSVTGGGEGGCGNGARTVRREGASPAGCFALLTRSTKGLRKLLEEQDVQFTMPLVSSSHGAEDAVFEKQALKELQEFERAHPGRTRTIDSLSGIDNTGRSLLHVEGNRRVHRLFDFLLNYRYIAGASAAQGDVPVLYSSVPFKNSTLRATEVVYRRMKKIRPAGGGGGGGAADAVDEVGRRRRRGSAAAGDTTTAIATGESEFSRAGSSEDDVTHCMELKAGAGGDLLIPPWVIQRLCRVLKEHQRGGFTASFVTDSATSNINCIPGDWNSRTRTGGERENQKNATPKSVSGSGGGNGSTSGWGDTDVGCGGATKEEGATERHVPGGGGDADSPKTDDHRTVATVKSLPETRRAPDSRTTSPVRNRRRSLGCCVVQTIRCSGQGSFRVTLTGGWRNSFNRPVSVLRAAIEEFESSLFSP